jgi:hypothetical protein
MFYLQQILPGVLNMVNKDFKSRRLLVVQTGNFVAIASIINIMMYWFSKLFQNMFEYFNVTELKFLILYSKA